MTTVRFVRCKSCARCKPVPNARNGAYGICFLPEREQPRLIHNMGSRGEDDFCSRGLPRKGSQFEDASDVRICKECDRWDEVTGGRDAGKVGYCVVMGATIAEDFCSKSTTVDLCALQNERG